MSGDAPSGDATIDLRALMGKRATLRASQTDSGVSIAG